MLWFALAVMTGLAVLVALWPLAFRRARPTEDASEVGFYRAQLAEIDRDVDRGQLPQPEAAAARTEAARRLIAAAATEASRASPGGDLGRRRIAAVVMLVAIPLTALGAYHFLGRPDLPDEPLAQRKTDGGASPEAVAAAIAKIETHLATTPDDARGWQLLAPVYMRMGRYDDAARAIGQLLRLEGENGERRADYGEALVAAAGGVVTADARASFERALVDKPGLPKARFYLALATEQDGDLSKAAQQYQSLLDDAKGAPWARAVEARLAKLKGEPPAKVAASAAPAGLGGMSPDQQEMVRGMVERLATRLAKSGGGPDEWERLIRAYSVLHETDKAKETLAAARTALANDEKAGAGLDALARDLGLGERTQ